MPSSKGQPRRCHGQVTEEKPPLRKLSLTPTQLKAGAEQTPNSHPQQYFTAVLKSIFPLSCNQGHWCSGPALARDPNAEANKPQTLQSQPRNWVLFQLSHSGPEAHKPQRLQILPRVKKPALASTFCGMASEERIFLALPFFFFWHSFLGGEFAGAHEHLALYPY